MKRRLSTRILAPNLIIVAGSLLLLAAVTLLLERLYLLQETKREFQTVRGGVENIVKSYKLGTLDDAQAQEAIKSVVRVSSYLYDVKVLILTEDMKYPPDAVERPLPEEALAAARADGGIATLQYAGESYLAAAIPLQQANGNFSLVLYTSLKGVDEIVRRIALIMLPALAGAALLAVLASVFVARRIAGPLRNLSRWAHSIGGRRFVKYAGESGTMEIDFLAESLNGMAQRLKDYDAAQKTFLQNASHELRTPLMSIQGYAEGIKHGVLADTNAAADVIVSESLRLSALVDDLLFLTRLETADGFYTFVRLSAAEVLGQCAEKLEGAAIKEGKKLTLLPCPGIQVNGDGEKLLRALMNLAGNCLRYAKSEVIMQASMQNGKAVITVRDDGPGFDPEDLKNLFQRFYKGKQGKYGLGLSIAKAIIEKHGGTLKAGNGEGGGAVFTVELPLISK